MEPSASKKFNCPSCAAPLEFLGGNAPTVNCEYCGQSVRVPRELRSAPLPANDSAPSVNVVKIKSKRSRREQPRTQASSTLLIAMGFILLIAGVMWLTNFWLHAPDRYAPLRVDLKFGGSGTGVGLFQEPKLIAVDGSGFSYIVDNTLRLQRFDAQGEFTGMWQIQGMPSGGLVADRAGSIYVSSNGAIFKYDGATGNVLQTIKAKESIKQFALEPGGGIIAVGSKFPDPEQLIWFDAAGNVTKRVPDILTGQSDPVGTLKVKNMTVDNLGNILLLVEKAPYGGYVYRFSPEGKYISRFGGKGQVIGRDTKEGQVAYPAHQIAVDEQNRIYVLDFEHIQRFDAEGHFVDWVKRNTIGGTIFDFALAGKNTLYVVGMDSQIYRLGWSDPR